MVGSFCLFDRSLICENIWLWVYLGSSWGLSCSCSWCSSCPVWENCWSRHGVPHTANTLVFTPSVSLNFANAKKLTMKCDCINFLVLNVLKERSHKCVMGLVAHWMLRIIIFFPFPKRFHVEVILPLFHVHCLFGN